MAESNSSAGKWVIRILLVIIFVQLLKYCGNKPEPVKSTASQSSPTPSESSSKVYRFNLTECLGKDLVKPATFTVDPTSTNWELDFNNGTSLTYTIISGNQYDPMCGLKAKDSYGDRCEICIKKEGDETVVTFDYSGKKLVYRGSYMN